MNPDPDPSTFNINPDPDSPTNSMNPDQDPPTNNINPYPDTSTNNMNPDKNLSTYNRVQYKKKLTSIISFLSMLAYHYELLNFMVSESGSIL